MSEFAKEILNNQEKLKEEIKELFQKIDTDHSNEIDKKEFRAFVLKIYQKSGKKVNNEIIDKFMKNLDKDKSGTLSLEEFQEFAISLFKTLSQHK